LFSNIALHLLKPRLHRLCLGTWFAYRIVA
jgi:hypothetical protein